jgi:hypothetical protein
MFRLSSQTERRTQVSPLSSVAITAYRLPCASAVCLPCGSSLLLLLMLEQFLDTVCEFQVLPEIQGHFLAHVCVHRGQGQRRDRSFQCLVWETQVQLQFFSGQCFTWVDVCSAPSRAASSPHIPL